MAAISSYGYETTWMIASFRRSRGRGSPPRARINDPGHGRVPARSRRHRGRSRAEPPAGVRDPPGQRTPTASITAVTEGFGMPRSHSRPPVRGSSITRTARCTSATLAVIRSPPGCWRTGRTIGVYAIATIPAARQNGYGAAMTARVVADGSGAGCDVAVLQASELGRPIYERLGFRVAVLYRAYNT